MSLKETRLERSSKFLLAIGLRGTVIEPDSPEFAILKDAYEMALPLLEGMRLRQLKDKDLDQRFLEILENQIMPYHKLIAQQGMEYFDRIRQHPEGSSLFPELTLYKSRRRDIVERWKATYSKKRKV